MKPDSCVKSNLRHNFAFCDMIMDVDAFKYTGVAIHLSLKMGKLETKVAKKKVNSLLKIAFLLANVLTHYQLLHYTT